MKRQLTEALAGMATALPSDADSYAFHGALAEIVTAARLVERLLPGECEHGETIEHGAFRPGVPGSSWMCSGQVWDEGIVEAVAGAIGSHYAPQWLDPVELADMARAVLSVIARLTEKVE